jgi:hypothetical protein
MGTTDGSDILEKRKILCLKIFIFWGIYIYNSTAVPEEQVEFCLLPAFKLVSYLPYSLSLKKEATYSSETLVDFQQTARR